MEKKDFYKLISELSNQIKVSLNEKQKNNFYIYMQLLLEWNEKINLTAITEPNEIILKHFIDSITINKYIEKDNSMILDIGTGAGFPGIPLKIIGEEYNLILVDSLQKRINFLEKVVEELELKNIHCVHSRAEELARKHEYREQNDIVVSRAVARLNTLLEYMLPFTKVGGKCICMKSIKAKEELEEAKNAIEVLGGCLEKVENILLPDSNIERSIIIIKKVKNTPKQYPRKAGTPSKQPII